jgi:hypothetical protein
MLFSVKLFKKAFYLILVDYFRPIFAQKAKKFLCHSLFIFLYLIINQPESFKNDNVFGTKFKINEAMRKFWFDDLLCDNSFTKIGAMLLNR